MEFGFWSLVPPVLTIALALITKNVFISLLIGILTGNLVLNHFAVFTGLNAGIYSILDTMTESNTLIIGSVLITAAVIHLAEKSGGIEGFVNVVVKRKARRVISMRDLKPGDVVHVQGIVCEIAEIAWQEPWDWREAYYLEFRDTNGIYRSWKQNFDGGYAELRGE